MAAWYENVDSTKKYRLGTRKRHFNNNEYVYLKGVTSTAQYSVVTYDDVGATALITANAVGDVAIAQGAVDATTKYGWYLIYGSGTAKCDTIASGKACFIDGTDGRVDDAVVTGDLIVGMYSRSADSSNTCTVQLSYPKVTDVLG
jgi:hypothetical protein